jgi:hypothetical protein
MTLKLFASFAHEGEDTTDRTHGFALLTTWENENFAFFCYLIGKQTNKPVEKRRFRLNSMTTLLEQQAEIEIRF